MINRYIILSVLLSLALLIVAGATYWRPSIMDKGLFRTDLEQQLYQKMSRGEVVVPQEKWLAYLKTDITRIQSLRDLNSSNKLAMESLSLLLATIGGFQMALLLVIYRRLRKSA